MKLYAVISVILFLTMLFVPLFSLLGDTDAKNAVAQNASLSQTSSPHTEKAEAYQKTTEPEKSKDEIRVLRASSQKVETVNLWEYIVCCVASEMPPTYETEALKAQAVISYTYALYLLSHPYSDSADITDSPAKHQAYLSRSEIKEKWGDDYEESIEKIEDAVTQTQGQYLTYNGEIIKPAYHAMSPGRTNSALDVWGSDTGYLQSVPSDGDKLSPKLVSTYDFTEKELSKLLSEASGEKIENIKIGQIDMNSGGYVRSIVISGISFTGEEIRNTLSLRSGAFTVSSYNNIYRFTCTGYGHGVGLSQNGAQFMAKEGSSYSEILKHYYTGVEIKS